MSKLATILVTAGVITPKIMRELMHWKLPVELDDSDKHVPSSAEEVGAAVQEALESKDRTEVRVMDCSAVELFRKGAQSGRLRLVDDDKSLWTKVEYVRDALGQYIVMHPGFDITDLACNGRTYLELEPGRRVYFHNVQVLYVGDEPTFFRLEPKEPR